MLFVSHNCDLLGELLNAFSMHDVIKTALSTSKWIMTRMHEKHIRPQRL